MLKKLKEILWLILSASLDTSENIYSQEREVKNVLIIVVITSNQRIMWWISITMSVKKALRNG